MYYVVKTNTVSLQEDIVHILHNSTMYRKDKIFLYLLFLLFLNEYSFLLVKNIPDFRQTEIAI